MTYKKNWVLRKNYMTSLQRGENWRRDFSDRRLPWLVPTKKICLKLEILGSNSRCFSVILRQKEMSSTVILCSFSSCQYLSNGTSPLWVMPDFLRFCGRLMWSCSRCWHPLRASNEASVMLGQSLRKITRRKYLHRRARPEMASSEIPELLAKAQEASSSSNSVEQSLQRYSERVPPEMSQLRTRRLLSWGRADTSDMIWPLILWHSLRSRLSSLRLTCRSTCSASSTPICQQPRKLKDRN